MKVSRIDKSDNLCLTLSPQCTEYHAGIHQRQPQMERDILGIPAGLESRQCWKFANWSPDSVHRSPSHPGPQTWENNAVIFFSFSLSHALQKLKQQIKTSTGKYKEKNICELHLRWSWGQAWLNTARDWRKAVEESWPGPTMLKKCAAIGWRGLGAASGAGSGSMWRTETARLSSVSFNTSSGLDSLPWVLEGCAANRKYRKNFFLLLQWATKTK